MPKRPARLPIRSHARTRLVRSVPRTKRTSSFSSPRARFGRNKKSESQRGQNIFLGLLKKIGIALCWLAGFALIGVVGWQLCLRTVLPKILFVGDELSHIVYLPRDAQQSSSVLIVQLNPDDPEFSTIWQVEGVDLSGLKSQEPDLLKRHLAQQLHVMVDEVEQLSIDETAFGTSEQLLSQVPQLLSKDVFRLIWSGEGRLTSMMPYILAGQKGSFDSYTIEEFLQTQLSPVVTPQTARACPVAVVNTTTTSGLAQEASQFLERSGIVVVRTASDQKSMVESRVTITQQADVVCEQLARRLKPFFAPDSSGVVERSEKVEEYRAAMMIELGSDWDPANTKQQE
ncbi:LytR C-terminal domain-containing protein [Candidatus Woesebacteria bacterium]|nr:LytR C-terminal domain-containing protein [Candidatus Woesebacteria bacterium]